MWHTRSVAKRIHLLRRAKSSWDDPDLADHERPLAPRGRKAAKRMARHLEEAGVRPDLVLCSSSTRTRQTLERVAPALPDGVPVELEDGLYAASASTTDCDEPRYSMASYIRPSTRAVSLMLSLWPIWEDCGSGKVTWAPWS